MTLPDATHAEVTAILHEQEMRGERLVNHIRAGFFSLSMLTLVGTFNANTPDANAAFVVQIGLALAYSAAVYLWFWRNKGRYAPWLKYVSITVDLVLLHMAAFIMAVNTSGAIEYFFSVVPIVLVMWNLLAALRNSVAACLYSAGLTGLLSALVLVWVLTGGDGGAGLVAFHPEKADYNAGVIGIPDEITRVVFTVITGAVSAAVAWTSRRLIVRAAQESLTRARLEQDKQRLAKYLSDDLAEAVLGDPTMFKLGGTRRHASILFSDIRNFTPFAEAREPEQVVAVLNEYFTEMVRIVFQYGGTLDKFLGDGLMAVFGVPFDLPHHELRSVLVALEMLEAVGRFNARHQAADSALPPLTIGVGIATGPCVAGNIGSPERMEYTSIGDTVNFAARLETLNKSLGTHIILSEETWLAVREHIPVKPLPPLKVKGKTGEPTLFAVDVAAIPPERVARLRDQLLTEDATVEVLPVAPPRSVH